MKNGGQQYFDYLRTLIDDRDYTALRGAAEVDPAMVFERPGSDTGSVLEYAVQQGDETAVRVLLDSAHRRHIGDSNLVCALFTAIDSGQEPVVASLLSHVTDIESRWQDLTPLMRCAMKGRADLVEMLLEVGADVNAVASDVGGGTALYYAAQGGHIEIARTLLNHGADPRLPDRVLGLTPIDIAARNGHDAVVQLLRGIE